MVLETVPADIAADIRDFLVRPTKPESVFNQAQRAHKTEPGSPPGPSGQTSSRSGWDWLSPRSATQFGPGDFNCEPTGWGYIDSGSVSPGPGWRLWTACRRWRRPLPGGGGLRRVGCPAFTPTRLHSWGHLIRCPGWPCRGRRWPDRHLSRFDQFLSSGGRCLSSGFG